MEEKRFQKNDSGFVCAHCGKTVEPLGTTSRNHCPHCLWSLHVDIHPGDRACECRGEMEPIAARPDARAGFVILHRCTRCGELHTNKAAYGMKNSIGRLDNTGLLIALTARPWVDQ